MKFMVFLVLILSTNLFASSILYRIQPDQNNEFGIEYKLRFTLGTHEGKAKSMSGEVEFDRDTLVFQRGQFVLPIDDLRSAEPKRDCHMREALGLNYDTTDFPENHICDGQNQIPGVVSYPMITLDIQSVNLPLAEGETTARPYVITPNSETDVVINGTWTIHNVAVQKEMPFKISVGETVDAVALAGEVLLKRDEFGIEVKPAGPITVRNDIRVIMNLSFGSFVLPEPNPETPPTPDETN